MPRRAAEEYIPHSIEHVSSPLPEKKIIAVYSEKWIVPVEFDESKGETQGEPVEWRMGLWRTEMKVYESFDVLNSDIWHASWLQNNCQNIPSTVFPNAWSAAKTTWSSPALKTQFWLATVSWISIALLYKSRSSVMTVRRSGPTTISDISWHS